MIHPNEEDEKTILYKLTAKKGIKEKSSQAHEEEFSIEFNNLKKN